MFKDFVSSSQYKVLIILHFDNYAFLREKLRSKKFYVGVVLNYGVNCSGIIGSYIQEISLHMKYKIFFKTSLDCSDISG